MRKYIIIFLFLLQPNFCHSYSEICENFIKCLLTDTEAGYVFFGSKPICYYKVSTEDIPLIDSSSHELEIKLRLGVQWWLLAEPLQKNDNYKLKITKQADAYEILCINKAAFLDVVQKNISVFQYILGPALKPELLFEKIINSATPFYDLLNHDNTLVGILLGFGTTNSIIGARKEFILDFYLAKPNLPYKPVYLTQDLEKNWDYLILNMLYDANRIVPILNQRPSFSFKSLEEEQLALKTMQNQDNFLLCKYFPKLIFSNFTNSDQLIAAYEQEQQNLLTILSQPNLTDLVLERLSLNFSNPESVLDIPTFHANDMASLLIKILQSRQFNSLEGAIEGILDGREDRYAEPDWDEFYKLWILEQLQNQIEFVDRYFTNIDGQKITPYVYIKTLKPGLGKPFKYSAGIFSLAIYAVGNPIPYYAEHNVHLDLNQTILGLAKGVEGMQQSEIREIYIHPAAAYGLYTSFDKWQPLKLVIRLESMDRNSHQITTDSAPLLPERSLILSKEDKIKLKEMNKALAYHEAKKFYQFYQKINKDQLIHYLKLMWGKPIKNINLLAIDSHGLQIWKQRRKEEIDKAVNLFESKNSFICLKNEQIYLDLEKEGNNATSWPRKISLIFKDLNGKVLKKTEYNDLSLKEFSLWNQGLQLGLKNCQVGDKGRLYIHPDLTDQALFRNPLANKMNIVEFDIDLPVQVK